VSSSRFGDHPEPFRGFVAPTIAALTDAGALLVLQLLEKVRRKNAAADAAMFDVRGPPVGRTRPVASLMFDVADCGFRKAEISDVCSETLRFR
jgi:hypothetical protein